MADNVTLNAGSGGDVVGADDIGGVKYQIVKIGVGAADSLDGLLSSTYPMPISDNNTTISVDDNNSSLTVDGSVTATLAAGSAIVGQVLLSDSEQAELLLNSSASAPVGTEYGLIVRNIPYGTQTVDTELPAAASLADATSNPSVPSVGALGMVWNGTTWDRMPGSLSAGLTVTVANPSSQTDTSAFSVTSDGGIPVMGIYEATGSTVGDGEVGVVGMTAGRRMKVEAIGPIVEDVPMTPTTTPGIPIVAYATATTKTAVSGDGDAVHLAADRGGQLYTVAKLYTSGGTALSAGAGAVGTGVLRVTLPTDGNGTIAGITTSVVPGTSATHLGKAIDTAAGATDTGVAMLAIRDDALSTLTPAEGDWSALRQDSTGALWVNVTNVNSQTDDAAFTAGTSTGVGLMGAATTDAVDSGDFGVLAMTLKRELHVAPRAVGAGLTIARGVSAASTNLTAISSNPCVVKSFAVSNNHATNEAYLRFYNIASGSVTVGTSSIAAGPFIIPPADSGHTVNFDAPLEFGTACSFSITGAMADNDTTAVAATQVAWTIQHKDA